MSKDRSFLDRRQFLKNGFLGVAGASALAAVPAALKGGQQAAAPAAAAAKATADFIRRPLGNTGIKLPVVSMGVMNSNNENLIQAALDSGIVHLDTAHGYQRGTNEGAIGKVLKGRPRDSYFIATKVQGEPRDRRTGTFSAETKAEPFLEKVDLSLQRLGLDYVDIMYLHNVSNRDSVLFEPLMGALQKIKKEGKARFIGVTTHSNEHDVVRAATEAKVYDVVLVSYNFRKTNLAELDPAIADAAKAGLGVIAMKTQAGGFWDREKTDPINMKAALKWALSNPNITTAIPGCTAFDQLTLNLEAMTDIKLTDKEKADLRLGGEDHGGGLYCQGCQACLPQCPKGLPLPDLMRSYMYAYGYRNLGTAYDLVGDLGVGTDPCADCGACAVKCTMGFDVRARVTTIAQLQAAPAELFG
ncbi:MAG: aldo/keto reductase [Candidatus Aminicenantes bacterium]|nr:aldo/keto reductase [Candidatus Aminicenantes bacterium]